MDASIILNLQRLNRIGWDEIAIVTCTASQHIPTAKCGIERIIASTPF